MLLTLSEESYLLGSLFVPVPVILSSLLSSGLKCVKSKLYQILDDKA